MKGYGAPENYVHTLLVHIRLKDVYRDHERNMFHYGNCSHQGVHHDRNVFILSMTETTSRSGFDHKGFHGDCTGGHGTHRYLEKAKAEW